MSLFWTFMPQQRIQLERNRKVFDKFPKYHIKILLRDFNAKIGKEDIFKPTIGKESLQEINNDNGVRLANFATSNSLKVKSTSKFHITNHLKMATNRGRNMP
jgi:hypothetical protein